MKAEEEGKAVAERQVEVASSMLALMQNINDSLGRFEYLEKLRAEELAKEIAADAAQAEARAAAQKAFDERQDRNVIANERCAAALTDIAATLSGIEKSLDRLGDVVEGP